MINSKKLWFVAAQKNDTDTIITFINKNFDIETRDKDGRTALHLAAENNATSVAEILIKNKANIESLMDDEGTPLIDAVANGHINITLLLLKYNANYLVRDECEWTIAHWIAREDHLDLLDALHNCFPSLIPSLLPLKRWNGVSPLHMAESAEMVRKFIALGAEIDGPMNDEIGTPLLEATFQNKNEVAICLVRHGANILNVDYNNETALDIASRYKNHVLENFFKEIIYPKSDRKKTQYQDNVTAAISKRFAGVDEYYTTLHSSLRIDLYFFTLIAYYRTNLEVCIETTNRQHGKSEGNNIGCHSAILPSLWDTLKMYRPHNYDTRFKQNHPNSYRTGILNGTHFENSLNLTVELDKAVNYFDSYYIEGGKNTLMRQKAIEILNKVAKSQLDPIAGLNLFLKEMHHNFLSVKTKYFNKAPLKTSPKETRATIYNAQYKGTFFNSCGFQSSQESPREIKVREDYIQAQLPLAKNDRIQLKNNPHLFSNADKNRIYEQAFLQVKLDMELPAQYIR